MNKYKKNIDNILVLLEEKIKYESQPQKLLLLQERYKRARCELEECGKISSNILGGVRLYLDSYSDYQNNALLVEMDALEQSLSVDFNVNFCPSKQCYVNFQKRVLGGIKIPHSTSQPVIYQENGRYYLAFFVFYYSRDDINLGVINRPTLWAIADLETGKIIEERETKNNDFSNARYDMKYNVRADKQYDTSRKYYDEAFAILDSVRYELIKTGMINKEEYKLYLDKIIANIPQEYQRFYKDLSI